MAEVGLVEDIKKLRAELESGNFTEPSVFPHGEVEVGEVVPTCSGPTHVAIKSRRSQFKGRRIHPQGGISQNRVVACTRNQAGSGLVRC